MAPIDIDPIADEPAPLPAVLDALPDPLPPVMSPTAPPSSPSVPTASSASYQDMDTLSLDVVGDIPPPPIPPPPTVAGLPGAATFSRPGTTGARPFRTPAFGAASRGPRFGPGVAVVGGAPAAIGTGDEDDDLGLSTEDAAELLRRLAGGA